MLGGCGRHQPEARGWFKRKDTFEDLTLVECPGCPSQPYQVRARAGLIVRFYSAQQGAVLAERIAKSRTKVVTLPAHG